MFNDPMTDQADESLPGLIHSLAAYLGSELTEVRNSGELFALLQHTDPEIKREAVQIHEELSQFIVKLSQV